MRSWCTECNSATVFLSSNWSSCYCFCTLLYKMFTCLFPISIDIQGMCSTATATVNIKAPHQTLRSVQLTNPTNETKQLQNSFQHLFTMNKKQNTKVLLRKRKPVFFFDMEKPVAVFQKNTHILRDTVLHLWKKCFLTSIFIYTLCLLCALSKTQFNRLGFFENFIKKL